MRDQTDQKDWRMEVGNPRAPIFEWQPIFEFNDEELTKFQELGKELDNVNRPVQHRIIRCPRR